VTLLGVGGVGKTRLALEVARTLTPATNSGSPFTHGVVFVPLAALTTHEAHDDGIATAIAGALGVILSGDESPAQQVRHYLQDKALLLVLDNMEQLVTGAGFIATLLRDAPALKALVASRSRLGLRGEWIVSLDGLPFPEENENAVPPTDEYAALELFTQAARASTPDFTLTPESVPAAVRICRLVAGLPLGIELAASWVNVLSCDEIADEIERSLDFLTSSTLDLPERQQSLRAVFASSWDLLDPNEQHALRRLAALRGSFTREAAAAVAGATLSTLASLLNKSLVRRADISGRYALLEPLRQYAAEQLAMRDEADLVAERHATYYLTLLAGRKAALRGPQQQAALDQLGVELAHIRDAWRWAVAHTHAIMPEAIDSLFHYYDMRSWFGEGALVFATLSEATSTRLDDRQAALVHGMALARQGWFTFYLGRQIEAKALLEQSLSVLRANGADAELIFSLNYLAAVCQYLGEYDQSRTLGQESLAITEQINDQYGRAVICNILGQVAYECGDYAEARAWSQQSLTIEEQIGNRWSMAFSLTNLGKVAYAQGNYTEARALVTQSLAIRESIRDTRGVTTCLSWLGAIAVALNEPAEAAASYAQSLALAREIGNRWGVTASLIQFGQLATAQGQHIAAARLFHDALRLALETGAAPQVRMVLAAAAPLVRQSGSPAWADQLSQFAMSPTPAGDQEQAALLFGWLSRPEHLALTQEEALHTAPQQAPHVSHQPTPRPAAPPPAAHGLTSREIEVLRLVAQGLTDVEIAEKLIVSPRTVGTHLSTIYSKLQVKSRSGATRFAFEHGLV
jgi:predicted ATPase/DNA-binding CsgD family transcriptional regulator